VSKKEKELSGKCGSVSDYYPWYNGSKTVAICSGKNQKMEKCELYCEDGSRPAGTDRVYCNRKTREFEPEQLDLPRC
jgi:hypothetical protein